MYCSPVSPGCCFLVLNCARSKMRFFLIPKCPSNFSMTETYTVLSTAVISVVSRTSCESGPIMYSSVLTWRAALSFESPEASLNCSNLCFHRGHCPGRRKSNCSRGCSCNSPAISHTLLPPCSVHYDRFDRLEPQYLL